MNLFRSNKQLENCLKISDLILHHIQYVYEMHFITCFVQKM
jgi:hypothetical protein